MKKKKLLKMTVLITSAVLFLSTAVAVSAEDAVAPEGEAIVGAEAPVEAESETAEETTEVETVAESIKPLTKDTELNLKKGTVCSNVFFNRESLSGLTEAEASDLINAAYERLKNTEFIIKSDPERDYAFGGDCSMLGISFEKDSALSAVKDNILSGNIGERYIMAKDLAEAPEDLTLNVNLNEGTITSYYNDTATQWNIAAKNASVSAMTGAVVVTPGQIGYTFDATEGVRKMCEDIRYGNLPNNETYILDNGVVTSEPELTTERASTFTIIGTYSTHFPPPTTDILSNRMNNLIVSTRNLTGRSFAPGEIVSALNLYGPVSLETGFLPAGTFNDGGHVDEVGGGICQTTTTLYNAALMAELEIIYRHNHSMLVTYVDPSRDAMVYAAGGSDFQFRNSSSDYIFLEGYVNSETDYVTINILGHEDHPADHSVRYETEIVEFTAPTINLTEDPSIALGWNNMGEKFRNAGGDGAVAGLKSRLYKITTDGGIENRTLFTDIDVYKPSSASYIVAPDTKIDFQVVNNRDLDFVQLTPMWANGMSMSSDPAWWGEETLRAFNAEMSALMAAKGLTWPYQGAGWGNDFGEEETEPETDPSETDVPAETTAPPAEAPQP